MTILKAKSSKANRSQEHSFQQENHCKRKSFQKEKDYGSKIFRKKAITQVIVFKENNFRSENFQEKKTVTKAEIFRKKT